MPPETRLRPCTVVVTLVHEDRHLGLPPGQCAAVRVGMAAWLGHYLRRELRDQPVRVELAVIGEGTPRITVLWDDPEESAEQTEAALTVGELVATTVADRYEAALQRARQQVTTDTGDGDDEDECVDCAAGIPLSATYLLPGDWITELDSPAGPFYRVVEIDRDTSVLVLDPGDGEPPVAFAVDMAAHVLKAPGSPAV